MRPWPPGRPRSKRCTSSTWPTPIASRRTTASASASERLTGLRGFLKRDAFRHIADQQAQDRAERVRREAEERRQLRARHSIPTWQGYLESEAAKGNEAALIALRGRMQRRTQMEAQLLQAQDAGEARHIVYQHLRPVVRRDGRMIYRVADGGVVSDEARNVRVNQVTAGAAFLALSLAADRFGTSSAHCEGCIRVPCAGRDTCRHRTLECHVCRQCT